MSRKKVVVGAICLLLVVINFIINPGLYCHAAADSTGTIRVGDLAQYAVLTLFMIIVYIRLCLFHR